MSVGSPTHDAPSRASADRGRRVRSESKAGFVATLVCLCSIVVAAQQNATISGTVTDEAKAAVAGVRVSAVERDSGRQLTAVTNSLGEYGFRLQARWR